MLQTTRSRPPGVALAGVLLVLLALALPARAGADPVTYTAPSGAAVTIDSGVYAAGGRVKLSGTGFTRVQGTGQPIVAIKPDEHDEAAEIARWTAGGPDARAPIDVGGGEWVLAFAARADGTFSGWIDLPKDLAMSDPATGLGAGQHVLRLLSGLLSTDNASPTDPINLGVLFASMDLRLGMLSASSAFYAGDTFPAGATVVPRGGAFAPAATLGVTLDGQAYAGPAITTDGAGALPAGARLPLPAGLAPGRHEFALRTGSTELVQPFTVAAPATAALGATTAVAGRSLTVTASGFRSIAGGGQKVAVMLGTLGVKACLTADATGALAGAVDVPAGATTETASPVRLLAGTSCVPGGEQDDLPARAVTLPVTVVAPAPADPDPGTGPAPVPPAGPIAPGGVLPPPPASTPKPVTPKPGALARARQGRALRLTLGAGTAKKVTITVKSAGRVRTSARAKAKVMALTASRAVAPKGGKATTVTLTVTAAGRRVLARYPRLKVVVRVTPAGGGAATTRTVTLKA